jgi:hypothetical protein
METLRATRGTTIWYTSGLPILLVRVNLMMAEKSGINISRSYRIQKDSYRAFNTSIPDSPRFFLTMWVRSQLASHVFESLRID